MLLPSQVVMLPSSTSSSDPVNTKYLTVLKYIYMVTGNEALKAVTKVIQLMGGSDIRWVDAVGQIVNKLCLPRYHKLLYKCSKPRYVGDHAVYYHAM